jgi:phosphonate transport system substrate-binding protein
MSEDTLLLGAVAYDPKVVTIWNGFKNYFIAHGLPFDYILFTNYERQVEALFDGQIHVAWNSPLAWLQTVRLAAELGRKPDVLAMRNTDRDLTSTIIARRDGPIRTVADMKGRRVAVGAKDSPQATLIPLQVLAVHGLEPVRDFELVSFDVLVGKHGDHIGGERDAALALMRGDVDAACLIDDNYRAFEKDGTIPPGTTWQVLRTPPYDHCNFTVLDNAPALLTRRFTELLLAMSYEDGELRGLLDLEGLQRWLPARTEGYRLLSDAVTRLNAVDAFITAASARCKPSS